MTQETLDIAVTEFAQSIGLLVRRAHAASSTQEFSWTEMGVLKRLERVGPATTADLARAQGMRPQSMRTIVAALEKAGMIERTPHPTDGRQILFSLTDAGVAARRQRQAAKLAWLTTAIDRCDADERRTLVDAIALIQRLGESQESSR